MRAGSVAAGSDPEYLAPEVRAGGPLTTAADVYALGTLFAPALRDAASDLGLVTFVSHLMKDDPAERLAAAKL